MCRGFAAWGCLTYWCFYLCGSVQSAYRQKILKPSNSLHTSGTHIFLTLSWNFASWHQLFLQSTCSNFSALLCEKGGLPEPLQALFLLSQNSRPHWSVIINLQLAASTNFEMTLIPPSHLYFPLRPPSLSPRQVSMTRLSFKLQSLLLDFLCLHPTTPIALESLFRMFAA